MDVANLRTNRREYLTALATLLGVNLLPETTKGESRSVTASDTADSVSLENQHVRVVFEKETGGIKQLTAKDTNTDLRTVGAEDIPTSAWFI